MLVSAGQELWQSAVFYSCNPHLAGKEAGGGELLLYFLRLRTSVMSLYSAPCSWRGCKRALCNRVILFCSILPIGKWQLSIKKEKKPTNNKGLVSRQCFVITVNWFFLNYVYSSTLKIPHGKQTGAHSSQRLCHSIIRVCCALWGLLFDSSCIMFRDLVLALI